MANFANKFAWSRRGYGAATDPPIQHQLFLPDAFRQPFPVVCRRDIVPPLSSGTSWPASNYEIDATILQGMIPILRNYPNRPLFQFDSTVAIASNYNNADLNPYFRYQALTRLGNLVTTRSNVYAFWITVGYFEVTPDNHV